MKADAFVSRLASVTRTATGFEATCPAHDDGRASLSVADGEKGLLLHCHAGCTVEAIAGCVGLKVADLFNGRVLPAGKPNITATYQYHDENGGVLFEVVRLEPKDFRQRAPNGQWSTKGIRRVPFHLPQLLAAVKDGRPVFVCEGEKDVLALEAAGFAATCNPGGAGKWRSEYGIHLKGAEVVVIADKDAPGRKHADEVAAMLKDVAASVNAIELPDTNGRPVKDAADFFAAGGDASELDELAQSSAKAPAATMPWLALIEDGAELQVRELPPVVEIVGGIVAECSKLSIVSSAKCYKTWLTIYLAVTIAHGVEFLGRRTSRRRLLYVNLELKPSTFTRRLQAIAKELGLTIEPAWFSHLSLRGKLAGLTVHEIINRIMAIARHRGATVVVIDPLFKLNTEGEENSSRDQTVFCNELDRLTTEGGCTAIFNDHSGKGNQSEKNPLDVIRGSSAKGGDLDAAMVLRHHEVEGCFRVDLVHRELPPVAPFTIGWRFPLMELRSDLSPDAMKKPKGGRASAHDPLDLLAAIADSTPEKPVSISAWATSAGVKRTTLNEYLTSFRLKGWITTTGDGNKARQFITENGRKAIGQTAAKPA